MAYRLAIAISGAVSLGSYESGVMFETIRAIGLHNRNTPDPGQHIKIDVLTGASAGGMTAAILAQKLLFEAESLQDPHGNDLFQPWVEMADLDGLLMSHAGDDPNTAILSSGFIAQIADKFLLSRYQGARTPDRNPHPAAADSLRLGLAMSNLNGLDYSIPAFKGAELASPNSSFTYTRFQDRRTFTVTADDDARDYWEPVSVSARSCGAFPFAFRPLHVARQHDEVDYGDPALKDFVFPEQAFTYTDGGVFNNSPLGMAKQLADQQDTGPRDYESRYFLYVSPRQKGSALNTGINQDNATLLHFARALVTGIFQQGRFQDWITAAYFNQVIEQFDDRAHGLRELLHRISDEERQAMDGVADRLLDHLYATDKPGRPSRQDDFQRLKTQFMVDEAARQLRQDKGEAAVDTWIKSAQVLEKSGRIGARDMMQIYTITATDDELAGEGLAAFAGFFDENFRKFDYRAGREKSRAFLTSLKEIASRDPDGGYLPLTNYEFPDTLPPRQRDLGQAGLADVDPQVRIALRKRLSDRARRLLKEAGVNGLVRMPLMTFFVNPRIRDALKL